VHHSLVGVAGAIGSPGVPTSGNRSRWNEARVPPVGNRSTWNTTCDPTDGNRSGWSASGSSVAGGPGGASSDRRPGPSSRGWPSDPRWDQAIGRGGRPGGSRGVPTSGLRRHLERWTVQPAFVGAASNAGRSTERQCAPVGTPSVPTAVGEPWMPRKNGCRGRTDAADRQDAAGRAAARRWR